MTQIINISDKLILESVPVVEPYGVEWDITQPTTVLTRIGNPILHHAETGLPVQNGMKRCLLLDDGSVNYYLDPNDSSKKIDGSSANLDGSDGQVMVEIPSHYRKFETEGNIQRALISTGPFDGAHQVPKYYVSAYEASVQRSTGTLSSVINLDPDYRGGQNTSSWDADDRSLLGKPVTRFDRVDFITAARNRGLTWHCHLYTVHKALFWLYTIEYANKNSQEGVNHTLTVDGYRQGGLGTGVTNIQSGDWSSFNGFNPFIPCGAGLANNYSGEATFVHPVLGITQIPQYRGIEHPFGHIWKWTEGVNIKAGNGKNMVYVADSFNFSDQDYNDYTYLTDMATSNGYIKDISFGNKGDIFASDTSGASSTTFWADYLFQSVPSTEDLRGLLLGGTANFGSFSGLAASGASNGPSYSNSSIGSRLCFANILGA